MAQFARGPQGRSIGPTYSASMAPHAALLIDFDNVTMGIRSDLTKELKNLLNSDIIKGKVAVQRAYADWRRYPQYIVPLSEASVDLIFAPAYGSSKKNATDIRLAIDALELVFTRPEIGTFILLSGDSDFSSLVLKLKEYGKYVIGVGIRESSSDLLVQNCDEYYSYNALAGLVKTSEEDLVRKDPCELVVESVARMKANGDVMRADRLKQVMQEIDPNFDEGNLGMAKFSKFCLEAAQRGLLKVTKLENGQLEVAPTDEARGEKGSAAAPREGGAEEARGERPEREGTRGRRGRRGRGGRGRDREGGEARPASATPPAPVMATSAPPASSDGVGNLGERLTSSEAFDLIRRAVAGLVTDDVPVPAEAVRTRVRELLGRDSESLSERNFARILRDAHDRSVVDVRKRGDSYEVAAAASAPSVADQLGASEAAIASAQREAAGTPAPVARSIVGRRPGRGKAAEPPADLLSVGVVELDAPAAPATDSTAEPKKRGTRKRASRAKPKA